MMTQTDFFFKGHGLGNDYIVLDSRRLSFRLTRRAIRLICNRNLGLGSDGIALLAPSRKADARMRILNPDGSEAQKSGNGARIFALYLKRYGLPGRNRYLIETAGGMIEARFRKTLISVDMGKASFSSRALPMTGKPREALREKIRVSGRTLEFTGVSIGNPHAVFFMKKLDRGLLRRLGPAIERNRVFPERVNVQFARLAGRNRVEAIIWERGAGETKASGSSACAVASAARRRGLVADNVRIVMEGGTLRIAVRPDWRLTMTGPADEVATGTLSRDLVSKLRAS